MENEERNLIEQLLEIEGQASELISAAQVENDRLLAQARADADSDYNEKFKVMSAQIEEEYERRIAEFKIGHESEINAYKEDVLKTQKDMDSFNNYLQSVL